MNAEAEYRYRARKRAIEARGLDAFRVQALQALQLKTVVKVRPRPQPRPSSRGPRVLGPTCASPAGEPLRTDTGSQVQLGRPQGRKPLCYRRWRPGDCVRR